MSELPTTTEWLEMGERRSQWALAYIVTRWRKDVGPLARKAYNGGPTNAEQCEEIARCLERLAITARRAADLAREENASRPSVGEAMIPDQEKVLSEE